MPDKDELDAEREHNETHNTPIYDEKMIERNRAALVEALREAENWPITHFHDGDDVTPVVVDHTVDENGQPTLMPQPKVIAGAVTGIALTAVVAMLAAVTPDLLDWAGRWAPVLFAGVVAVGSALAAYVKKPGNVS